MPDDAAPAPLAAAYGRHAPFWAGRMARLGYLRAYGDLARRFGLAGPAGRVIDIGCGAGDLAMAWLDAGGQPGTIALCDPSRQMLDHAALRLRRAGTDPRLYARPLHQLSSAWHYDLILCAHVLEHGADLSADLAALARLLCPGGRLLLIASKPHWCNRLIWLRWRHRSFPPDAIRAAALRAGLRCTDESGLGPGPPGRTSRAYLITRPYEGKPHADRSS